MNQFYYRAKRSALSALSDADIDNILNEIVSDEELLNMPIHGIDKDKAPNAALLQYLLMRKPSLSGMNFSVGKNW